MWTRGVFVFFSTEAGDAWLLEASGMDALQIAAAGRQIEVDVTQTDDAIEVTWSHQFTIRKDFTVADYADQRRTVFADYPAARIRALLSRARSIGFISKLLCINRLANGSIISVSAFSSMCGDTNQRYKLRHTNCAVSFLLNIISISSSVSSAPALPSFPWII